MTKEKKKILIVNNNLATGGVQRALVNVLNQIKDEYEITLFVFCESGEYRKSIPSQVKVIEASPLLRLLGISQKNTKGMHYITRAVLVLYTKIFSNHLPISLLVSTQKKLSGFDVAISYLHSSDEKTLYGGCNEFVIKKVKAKLKITFLHCDFLNYGGNTIKNRRVYRRFDKIATVSESCRYRFNKAMPELVEKTEHVYNCHNYSEYIDKANINTVEYPKGVLNIVTVARLSSEKGILRGINVIQRLIKENYELRWHIIGDGSEKSVIKNEININENLSEHVFLYGNQENPYRYMKNADLFFLPSYHEAAPMVFDEAKCLGIPIISTKTTSANEMIKEGQEGFVCENSEEGIYRVFKKILDMPGVIDECRGYLSTRNHTNELAIEQFRKLISNEGL